METEILPPVEELVAAAKAVMEKLSKLALECNDEEIQIPEESGKKGRRTRKRKKKDSEEGSLGPSTSEPQEIPTPIVKKKEISQQKQTKSVSSQNKGQKDPKGSDDLIDHHKQLLLELLCIPESSWMEHIATLAVDKGIIKKPSKGSSNYAWNSEYQPNSHTSSLLEKLNNPGTSKSKSSIREENSNEKETKKENDKDKKRKRRFLNLDETINELIPDSYYHVTLSPHKIRSEAELDRKLARFAETLQRSGKGKIIEAELFVPKQGTVAFVRTEPEIVLRKQKLRRCALNGDIVRVFVFYSDAKWTVPVGESSSPPEVDIDVDSDDVEVVKEVEELAELTKTYDTGFVIRVVKPVCSRSCVGQFGGAPTPKTNSPIFFPHDRGIPPINISGKALRESFIPKETSPEEFFANLPNRLFEVEITGVNSFYYTCNGNVITDIGQRGDIRDENACILLRHGFKKNNIDRLDRLGESYVAKAAEKQSDDPNRVDLTDMCIFTIDPATARDLDDAVSCRKLENGNYEVGVHISDVTQFVLENTDLDQLVREAKTTSVYMVDQVYHMLPTVLCMSCSLLPGEKKKAVSMFVEMTSEAEQVGEPRFVRSEINSCCQLSYEQAQKIIDNEDPVAVAPVVIYNNWGNKDLRTTIKALHKLSVILRERRLTNGALKFDKPKYYFKLDAENNPIELVNEGESKPAHQLIEEFMILANQIVGKAIFDAYPEHAILRQHSPPKWDQMAKVKAFFRELNFPDLNYRTAQEINDSMEAIKRESERRGLDKYGFELVLNGLLAKPMNRAQYFCTGDDRYAERFDHFALSIPFYTHFTSPIRRYPDIMVHRLLIALINGRPAPRWDLTETNNLMSECNRQKMNAKYASEDSARLFLMHYLRKEHPNGRAMMATVSNILKYSIEVKLWETGDELILRHSEIEEEVGLVASIENGISVVVTESWIVRLTMFSTCRVNVTVDKDRLKASLLVEKRDKKD